MSDKEMSLKDAYETLGLEETASDDEVNAAFRKEAIKEHSDKNPKREDDSKLIEAINARDIIRADKNEPTIADSFKETMKENQKRELQKTQLQEIKNRKIKNVNNKIITRTLPQAGIGIIFIIFANSIKEIQPSLESVMSSAQLTESSAQLTDALALMSIIMILVGAMMTLVILMTSLSQRARHIETIDDEYDVKFNELIREL